jgi:Leucine-rich repeat (LRR) protein
MVPLWVVAAVCLPGTSRCDNDTAASSVPSSVCLSLTFDIFAPSTDDARGTCSCSEPLAEIHCRHLAAIPQFNSPSVFNALYLSRQAITSVPSGSFTNLRVRRIVLNFNNIGDRTEAGSFAGLESDLRELFFGGCRIDRLPDEGLLDGLQELRILHLWKNELVRLPVGLFANCCREMTELLLWGNKIESIEPETFAGLTSLRKLDLDNNRLSAISRDTFKELTALEVGERVQTSYCMRLFEHP